MGSSGKQLDKPAIASVTASPLPLAVGDVAVALFPPAAANLSPSSLVHNSPVTLPPRRDFPTLGSPELRLLPLSPSPSDVNLESFCAVGNAAVCMPSMLSSPRNYASRVGNGTVHTMVHGPPALSPPQQSLAMEGALSLSNSGNTAMHESPTSFVHEFSPWGSNTGCASIRSTSLPPQGLDAKDGLEDASSGLLSAELSRRVFMRSYVHTLLPELKRIHSQSASIPLNEKLSAVKLAADMSLALSAGGNNTWSQALIHELATTSASKPLSPSRVRKEKRSLRKSSIFRGSFYARRSSFLRSRPRRGSSHAGGVGGAHNPTRFLACLSMPKGASHVTSACISTRGCSHANLLRRASSASFPRGGSHQSGVGDAHHPSKHHFGPCALPLRTGAGQFALKRAKRHQTGLSSYVKILRNSRSKGNCGGVKASVDTCNETGRAALPLISKEHIESLGGLVPGGRNMDVPLLLQETADYILSLQMQVEALKSLSHFASL